jgi:hypothetical protein
MTDSQTTSYTALAQLLESRLMEWEKARKPQELKLLECYQDVMRIARDDDTSGTGAAKSRKAKSLFIGSTRNKVRSASAKINDALFGNGQMPFDTEPTNEELAEFADVVEDIITDQMERGQYKDMLSTGVDTLTTYGTGFVFGPFVRKETLTETMSDGVGGIKEQVYEFDLPYFELASTLDVIPDPEARDIKRGLGLFWVTMESPHTVAAWKADKNYKNIDQALLGSSDNGSETGSEQASQLRGNVEFWHNNSRIKVARFFGKVSKRSLKAEMYPEADEADAELVDVIAIMAGGVVVKVDESPYSKKCPSYRCVYEAVANEIWGVGVAENNAPHQKTVNAAFRLFMEGKGMALLGTRSVDRSRFLPTEDFKKYPGKVYQFNPGLTPDDRKSAIIEHNEPDITGGWLDVIRMSEQFSDDDTGITKYTQGDDSSNLNKTASGISMIMSAASLPTKKVIQNIDSMWIEPTVEGFIEWNLKYLDPETVMKIHGQKHAEAWAKIKQFGKTSFMTWKATGTSSFMAKEVLVNKIRAFAEFAMSNPVTAPLVDARELLEQTWNAMEIGKESPIAKDEQGQSLPPQVQQQMQQMEQQIQQMGEALGKAGEEVDKLETGQQQKIAEAEAKAYEAEQKRMADVEMTKIKEEQETARELQKTQMQLEAQKEIELMKIAASAMTQQKQSEEQTDQPAQLDAVMAQIAQMTAVMAAPKRVIRDENGQAMGFEPVMDASSELYEE